MTLRIPKRGFPTLTAPTGTDPKDRPAACTLAEWHMMDVTQLRRCRDSQKKNAWRKKPRWRMQILSDSNIFIFILNIFFQRTHTHFMLCMNICIQYCIHCTYHLVMFYVYTLRHMNILSLYTCICQMYS